MSRNQHTSKLAASLGFAFSILLLGIQPASASNSPPSQTEGYEGNYALNFIKKATTPVVNGALNHAKKVLKIDTDDGACTKKQGHGSKKGGKKEGAEPPPSLTKTDTALPTGRIYQTTEIRKSQVQPTVNISEVFRNSSPPSDEDTYEDISVRSDLIIRKQKFAPGAVSEQTDCLTKA